MNVIGLDLSINGTGICVGDRSGETLTGTTKMGDRRLWRVFEAVDHYITASGRTGQGIGLAVIEHNLPHGHSGPTLDYVHGAARAALAKHDVPFAYVYPTTLKVFATGDSSAEKDAMVDAVTRACGWTPSGHDVADAWWLREMGRAFLYGLKPDSGPAAGKAIDSVEWPLKPGDSTWPQPYGPLQRKPVTKKCQHGIVCLKNGDHWLHPFNIAICDKPPKK